jgi:hypothetical protein
MPGTAGHAGTSRFGASGPPGGTLWRWRVPGRIAAVVRVGMPISQDVERG